MAIAKKAVDQIPGGQKKSKKELTIFSDKLERSTAMGKKGFKVILTGSGMANGGPVLDYLKKF